MLPPPPKWGMRTKLHLSLFISDNKPFPKIPTECDYVAHSGKVMTTIGAAMAAVA